MRALRLKGESSGVRGLVRDAEAGRNKRRNREVGWVFLPIRVFPRICTYTDSSRKKGTSQSGGGGKGGDLKG